VSNRHWVQRRITFSVIPVFNSFSPIIYTSSHYLCRHYNDYRRNNRRDLGRLVPQLLGWGTNIVLVFQFAVVFKKQEVSQQVVTRIQDLASEFSQISRGWYRRTLTAGGGRPPPASNTQRGLWPLAGRCWDPNLGPPQLFSRGCALITTIKTAVSA